MSAFRQILTNNASTTLIVGNCHCTKKQIEVVIKDAGMSGSLA